MTPADPACPCFAGGFTRLPIANVRVAFPPGGRPGEEIGFRIADWLASG